MSIRKVNPSTNSHQWLPRCRPEVEGAVSVSSELTHTAAMKANLLLHETPDTTRRPKHGPVRDGTHGIRTDVTPNRVVCFSSRFPAACLVRGRRRYVGCNLIHPSPTDVGKNTLRYESIIQKMARLADKMSSTTRAADTGPRTGLVQRSTTLVQRRLSTLCGVSCRR